MKKAILLLAALSLLISATVACNTESAPETQINTEATDAVSTQATEATEPIATENTPTEKPIETEKPTESNADITVENIIKFFAYCGYNTQNYNEEMIAEIRAKLNLNGEISSVVHILRSYEDGLLWAYVYELTDENDAIAFEENRRAFVESTEENGTCLRFGHIVVYGNSPHIASIAQ